MMFKWKANPAKLNNKIQILMLHYNKIKMDNRKKIKIINSREGKALDNSLNKVVNKVQAEEVVEEI